MLRRTFLATTAIIPVAGCGTIAQTWDSKLAQIVSDVGLIANGVSSILPTIGSLAGLTEATKSTIQMAVEGIRTVAEQIKGITSTAAGQPLIQKIGTYLNTIISALAMLPLPPQITTILQAAMVILPILQTIVGLLADRVSSPRFQSTMSPDVARAVLKSA